MGDRVGVARAGQRMPIKQSNSKKLLAATALSFLLMVILAVIVVMSSLFIVPPKFAVIPTATSMPTATPTPFDPSVGAVLPNDRIVAYYGYACSGYAANGPISMCDGNNYPRDFMDPFTDATGFAVPGLKQVGAQFQTADPLHPVQLAIDLVVNTFTTCDQSPTCSVTSDSHIIGNYIDYCQKHNLLLFLDVQMGRDSVQDMVTQMQPYLAKYAFVHLALDTEFHYPSNWTASDIFYAPGAYARGFILQDDINWAVAKLSQISEENHLPRKVLMLHQLDNTVIRYKTRDRNGNTIYAPVQDHKQIKTDPHVAIVVHTDGFGAISDKVGNYVLYVKQEPLQYGGFKIFFHRAGATYSYDISIMTPQQIIALSPAPLMITYQ